MSNPNRTLTLAAFVALAPFTSGPLCAQKNPDLTPYFMTDRAAEVALARSAAPRQISDSATILVLTRTGFVEAAHGTNGFSCFVLRSFFGRVGDPDFWNPRVRAPHCLNTAAMRTIYPEFVKRAEWITAGVSPTEIRTRTLRAYVAHELPMPAPGAMAYMLSPQQYLVNDNPHWMPHLMFYHDKSIPAAAYGAGGMTAPIINGSAGDDDNPVMTLLIPVPRWSDGTPAHVGAGH
jgi:hypothetical protein